MFLWSVPFVNFHRNVIFLLKRDLRYTCGTVTLIALPRSLSFTTLIYQYIHCRFSPPPIISNKTREILWKSPKWLMSSYIGDLAHYGRWKRRTYERKESADRPNSASYVMLSRHISPSNACWERGCHSVLVASAIGKMLRGRSRGGTTIVGDWFFAYLTKTDTLRLAATRVKRGEKRSGGKRNREKRGRYAVCRLIQQKRTPQRDININYHVEGRRVCRVALLVSGTSSSPTCLFSEHESEIEIAGSARREDLDRSPIRSRLSSIRVATRCYVSEGNKVARFAINYYRPPPRTRSLSKVSCRARDFEMFQ